MSLELKTPPGPGDEPQARQNPGGYVDRILIRKFRGDNYNSSSSQLALFFGP